MQPAQQRIEQIKQAIQKVEQERNNLLNFGQKGIISFDELAERIQPLDKRLKELNSRLDSVLDSVGEIETPGQRLDRLKWLVQNWRLVLEEMPTLRANRILRQSFLVYIEPRAVVRIEIL